MTQDRREKVRAYFGQPGFRRLLEAIWKKYASLERVGGSVRLEGLNTQECEAVNGFFGWNVKPGGSVEVKLQRFMEELQSTPYAMTLPELHEILLGCPLRLRSELAMQREEGWESLFVGARSAAGDDPAIVGWLERLKCGEAAGYRTLRDLYREDRDSALSVLTITVQALSAVRTGVAHAWTGAIPGSIEAPWIRLPVLAAGVTGNPHAFDWRHPAGRMLWYAISEIWKRSGQAEIAARHRELGRTESEEAYEEQFELDSWTIRETYRLAGIADDDISSFVVIWESGAIDPVVLTLRQIERLTSVPRYQSIYAVENPAVFSTLLDAVSAKASLATGADDPKLALVLLSGQPSVAALRWLERCAKAASADCRLHYSGDYDVKGLQIAQALAERFPDRFASWRLDRETYQTAGVFGPAFTEKEAGILRKLSLSWDPGLTKAMVAKGKKLFQEQLVPELVNDWVSLNERLRSR